MLKTLFFAVWAAIGVRPLIERRWRIRRSRRLQIDYDWNTYPKSASVSAENLRWAVHKVAGILGMDPEGRLLDPKDRLNQLAPWYSRQGLKELDELLEPLAGEYQYRAFGSVGEMVEAIATHRQRLEGA